MSPDEAGTLLVFANQIDPLISVNDANAEVWWSALSRQEFAKAKWCITDYYANTAPGRDGRIPALTPGVLRQRIGEKAQMVAAKHTAIEAAPVVRNPNSYRASDPERWDRMKAQGRDQYRAELRARGITPHREGCPDCSRDDARKR